jgi:hypothetical protein
MAGLCGLPRIPDYDAAQSWAMAAAGQLPALLATARSAPPAIT